MIEFRLPSLGSDMEEGTLLRWEVAPGDAVRAGQVVAVVDTAKAAIDVECWSDGIVHRLLVEPGTTLPVGAPLALLREAGEDAAAIDRAWAQREATSAMASASAPALPSTSSSMAGPPPVVPAAVVPSPAAPASVTAPPPQAGRRAVSPAARRLAREHGVDLGAIVARGAAVTLEDVRAAIDAGAGVPAAATRADAMRRVIAAAMTRSHREIPHYYLAEDVPFERAAAWLAQRNAARPPQQRLLPAALLVHAVARTLAGHPEFNGFWRDGGFVPGDGIHVGVAISLRDGGLVAPALRDADRLDVEAVSRGLLDLVGRARAGTLRSSELGAATVTVTSLGDGGVGSVFGVIHPPQVALIGFGRVTLRPWAFEDASVRAVPVVTASLAADHRVSDGHRGARWLAAIAEQLQNPETMAVPR